MPPRSPTPHGADEHGSQRGGLAGGPRLITVPRLVPATPGSGVLEPGYLVIACDIITEVGQGPPPRPADLALGSGVLVPGLVGLQVNGYLGEELMTAGAAGWAAVASGVASTGATSFMPTFITAPLASLTASLRTAAVIVAGLPAGRASVLGVHLEGPFIAARRRGAHNPAWRRRGRGQPRPGRSDRPA